MEGKGSVWRGGHNNNGRVAEKEWRSAQSQPPPVRRHAAQVMNNQRHTLHTTLLITVLDSFTYLVLCWTYNLL